MTGARPMFAQSRLVPPDQAVLAVSGQVALDAAGAVVGVGDIQAQTRQTYANLDAVVRSAGGRGLTDVVACTVYLVDADHIDGFTTTRAEVFADHFATTITPTSTLLVVNRLVHPEFLIEIEALAAVQPSVSPPGDRSEEQQ